MSKDLLQQFGDLIGLPKDIVMKAVDFTGDLIKEPTLELMGILNDKIKLVRFKNQVNILLMAKKHLDEKGISPVQISFKTLVPLLENASLEEDHEIKAKWAALLSNVADPNFNDHVIPSYIRILNELSPIEASILDQWYDWFGEKPFQEVVAYHFTEKEFGINSEQLKIILDNFFRFNLVTSNLTKTMLREITEMGQVLEKNSASPEYSYEAYTPVVSFEMKEIEADLISFSSLGIGFIRACKF